jgi:hypothetical protein
LNITQAEEEVIKACTVCLYGELQNVQIDDGPQSVSRELSPGQEKFIDLLRDKGITFADTIVVHNGQPMQLEVEGTSGNIKYRQKLRI